MLISWLGAAGCPGDKIVGKNHKKTKVKKLRQLDFDIK